MKIPIPPGLVGFFGTALLRLINCTLRWEKTGLEQDGVHWTFGEPVIYAFWHGDQLMAPFSYLGYKAPKSDPKRKRREIHVLISEHSDGRLIAAVMRQMGVHNVAGSSSKGGARALVQMRKVLLNLKHHIAITPDGPRGPKWKVKPGTISLAAQSNTKILPFALTFENSWKLGSWDGMEIPKPFSRARMKVGEALFFSKEDVKNDMDSCCMQLENALNAVKAELSFERQDSEETPQTQSAA